MKSFIIISLLVGIALSVYTLMSPDEKQIFVNKKTKTVALGVLITFVILFAFAVFGSNVSVKLF